MKLSNLCINAGIFDDLTRLYSSSPPIEVLKYFIEIYRTKIHMQPLPLFDLSDIQQVLSGTSQFLLWSFLSLTLKFSSHQFYGGKEPEAIAFYTRSAEDQVMKLAVEGATCPKVSQSLCLLALSEIKGKPFNHYKGCRSRHTNLITKIVNSLRHG